jgi:hypothetical protein
MAVGESPIERIILAWFGDIQILSRAPLDARAHDPLHLQLGERMDWVPLARNARGFRSCPSFPPAAKGFFRRFIASGRNRRKTFTSPLNGLKTNLPKPTEGFPCYGLSNNQRQTNVLHDTGSDRCLVRLRRLRRSCEPIF